MFPELELARALWRHGLARAQLARHPDAARPATRTDRVRRDGRLADLGATALEWAVISAILVTAAVFIGGIVYNVVKTKGNQLNTCANQPVGTSGC